MLVAPITDEDERRLDQKHNVGVGGLDALDGVSAVGYKRHQSLHQSSKTDQHLLFSMQVINWFSRFTQHKNMLFFITESVKIVALNIWTTFCIYKLFIFGVQ